MADGTPRRGSTIAAKIAAFRSLGGRGAPLRLPEGQDANQEQDFWWLKHVAGEEDVQSRGPARPGGRTREAQHPPEPDLRRKAIDQSAKREGSGDAGRPHAPAAGPPSHPPAVIAALQRLAQEHPSLYHAVMSLERGPDGRLSDAALGMISKALGHSRASSHDQGADAGAASRQPDAADRQGLVHGSHVRGATSHAAAGQAGYGGHTTTTFMAQQPYRWQGSAAGQGGVLAANQAPGQKQEEPIDSLLARYRPRPAVAEYMEGSGTGDYVPAAAGPSADGPAVGPNGTSALSRQIPAAATVSARPAAAAPALVGSVAASSDVEAAKGEVHRSRPASRGGESDSGVPGQRRRSRSSSSSPERRPRTAPGQAQAPGDSTPADSPMPLPPTSRDSAAGEKLHKLYRLANVARQMAQREGGASSNAEISHGASGLIAGQAGQSPGRGQPAATTDGAEYAAGSAPGGVRGSQARERFQRAAAMATAVTAAAVAAAGTEASADAGRVAAGTGPGSADGPGRPARDRNSGGGSSSSIGELVLEPSLASYHSAPAKDAATAAAAAAGAAAAAVAAAAAAEVAATARALEEQRRQQEQHLASVPPADAAPAAAAAAAGAAASASRAATAATAAAAAANPSLYPASNPDAPAARRVQFSPNEPQVRLFTEGSPPTAAAANPQGMPTGPAGASTSPSITSTGHSFPGHSNSSFSGWAAGGSATGTSSNPAPLPTGAPAPATSTGTAPGQVGPAGPQAGAPAGTSLPTQHTGQPPAHAASQPTPAPVQQVYLVPSPHRRPNDPNGPKPTHIFIPADPGLPPALVAVPGFEPLPRRSLSPPKPGRVRSQSASPTRPGGSGTSPPGRTSPEKADKAAEGGGAAGADQGSPGASGSAAGAGAGGRRERTEVDKLLDSDSDDEEGQGQGRGAQGRPGGSPGRPLSDLDAELQARAQAAAQAEREASSYTRNRLSRLMDQVSAFRRVEGERQMREGERIKMLGEFKSMSIDQLTALLGPDSALLKEINAFRELYTGNLQLVQQQANEHTRAVLGALQQASDTAVAVKEAVVEATLQQQQEMMEVVEKVAAAAPPPPQQPRSPLLQMSTQTLFSGLPTAPSELLNPSWWRTLLDPANRAVLDAAGAGAQDSASGPQVQAPGGADAPELRLAQRVAGVASAIRSSLDRAQSPGGLPGGGVAAAGGGGLSVDAITQAARQVSLTLDVAVREFLDRRCGAAAHATPAPGGLGFSDALPTPSPGSPAAVQAPLPYAGVGAAALQGAAVGLVPMHQPSLGSGGLGLGMQPGVPMLGQVIPPGLGPPGMMLPGSYFGSGNPVGGAAAMPGAAGHWVAQPVSLAPLVLPDGTVLQQPLTAAAVLPGGPALQVNQGMPHMQQPGTQPNQHLHAVGVGGQAGGGAAAGGSVVAFGPPASTAAAALQPQLVAVHGPMPAGGASAAAIANLPACGPAVVLPGGQHMACHGPTYVGAAPGGMVRVPQGGSMGPMPGEGLPCRMDVQLAAMAPAAPPGPLPVPHQREQRRSQEQLGDQQHAAEERMDHHTAQQQGHTQPSGTYLTATYQEHDDQVSYDQYTWPHGEEAHSATHADHPGHPGAWYDRASAREERPPWSQANESRVGGSSGVSAGTGPAAAGPGGDTTHSTYDYLLVSHPSISTRPSTSGGAGGGYEGERPGILRCSGSDAVAALASALAGAMGVGSGPPSTVGTEATSSRATARRALHYQTPGESSGSVKSGSSDRDGGRRRDGGAGRSERSGRSLSRGGEGREQRRESRFARESSGGRDSRSASRSPSRPHSSPERAAIRSGRPSGPSRSPGRPLSGENAHGERDHGNRRHSKEPSQSPSGSPSRPESHAGSRHASRAGSRTEAPWLAEYVGYRTGSVHSEAGRHGQMATAAADAAAHASEPSEGLDSSAAASEASLKTGVAELPRRRRSSQQGQLAGPQAPWFGQDQLRPGPSISAPAPQPTAPLISTHEQTYPTGAPAKAAEAQNQQQHRWQDIGGGAGSPSVPPRAEAMASVPVPGVAAVLHPPAVPLAQASYAAAPAAGPVAMQLLQQQQQWWGQQHQRAGSPPPATQPLRNAASTPLSPHQPLDPVQVTHHPQPAQHQQQLQPTWQQHSMPTRQAYHPPPVVLPGSPTRLAHASTDPAYMPAWPRVASAVPPGYGIQQDALARGRMVAVAAGANLAAAVAATPGVPPPVTVIPPQPHTRMIPLSMQKPSMVAGYPPPGAASNPYNRMAAAPTSAAGAGSGLAQRAAAQSAQEALTAVRQGQVSGLGDGGFAFSHHPLHSLSNDGSVQLVGSSPTRTAAHSVAPSGYGSAQGMASTSPAVAAVAAVAASATSPGFARSSYGWLQAATGVQAPQTASPTAHHSYYHVQQAPASLLQTVQLSTAQAPHGQGYPGGQVTGMSSTFGTTGIGHAGSTQQPASAHVGTGVSTTYQGTGVVSARAAQLPLPEAGAAARAQEVARAYDETMMQLQAVYKIQGRG